MAYSEASRVDEATARMTDTDSVQTNFRAAVKTFGEAIDGIMTTYTLNNQDQQDFRDLIIDMCRDMDAKML